MLTNINEKVETVEIGSIGKSDHFDKSRFKVMTYNMHSGIGRDRVYSLDRIAEVILTEAPDIVALQEVDVNLRRSNFEHQARELAAGLDMYYHFCANVVLEDGEYGIATLSRFPISQQVKHDLSFKRRLQPRGTLRTDIAVNDDTRLHIFNVHLGLRTRERQHQVQKLLSDAILLDESLKDPVIVMGDFNDRPISVVHQKLRAHFIDAFNLAGLAPRATFRKGPVIFRLDHIYVSPHLRPVRAYVVKSEMTRVASDHQPLVTFVEFP